MVLSQLKLIWEPPNWLGRRARKIKLQSNCLKVFFSTNSLPRLSDNVWGFSIFFILHKPPVDIYGRSLLKPISQNRLNTVFKNSFEIHSKQSWIWYGYGHPCYGKLTAVKRVFADQCYMTVLWAQVYKSLGRSRQNNRELKHQTFQGRLQRQ